MQVENQGAEDGEDAVAVGVGDADAEDRLPDLRCDDVFLQRLELLRHTLMNASGSVHSPRSWWNCLDLSTTIWPSDGSMKILARSSGRGAGPSKLTPVR